MAIHNLCQNDLTADNSLIFLGTSAPFQYRHYGLCSMETIPDFHTPHDSKKDRGHFVAS